MNKEINETVNVQEETVQETVNVQEETVQETVNVQEEMGNAQAAAYTIQSLFNSIKEAAVGECVKVNAITRRWNKAYKETTVSLDPCVGNLLNEFVDNNVLAPTVVYVVDGNLIAMSTLGLFQVDMLETCTSEADTTGLHILEKVVALSNELRGAATVSATEETPAYKGVVTDKFVVFIQENMA